MGCSAGGNSPAEPLRLARDERRELVGRLADEGMSTRAIAPIVGVDKDTVRRDLISTGANTPVDDAKPTVRTTEGRDGKNRTYASPEPKAPRATPRRAITDQFFDAAFDLGKTADSLVSPLPFLAFAYACRPVTVSHFDGRIDQNRLACDGISE